jgi:hypothetical protein
MKYFTAIAICISCLITGCNKGTQTSESQEIVAIQTREPDLSIGKAIEETITDSLELTGQDNSSELKTYRLFYNGEKQIVKVFLNAESLSGDVVNAKRLYFDIAGNTVLALYSSSVIPEDFFMDAWVELSERNVKASKVESSDTSIHITSATELVKYVSEPIFNIDELKKFIADGVLSGDLLENMQDGFEAENGTMPGTEKFTYEAVSSKNQYSFPDLLVGETSKQDEASGESIQEVFISKPGKDPLFLPKYTSFARFAGKSGDFLFIEYSLGLASQIHIYSISKERFVYDSKYVIAKIKDGFLVLVREINESTAKWLPSCEKEKAVGQGVQYNEVVKVDLRTMGETPTGQILCSVAQ